MKKYETILKLLNEVQKHTKDYKDKEIRKTVSKLIEIVESKTKIKSNYDKKMTPLESWKLNLETGKLQHPISDELAQNALDNLENMIEIELKKTSNN